MTGPVSVGVHWMRGTTVQHGVDDVLGHLAGWLDASVEVLLFGRHGYANGYRVGPVQVFHHPDQLHMGVCVDVDGTGCELLGSERVAELYGALALRVSRLDLAVDGCPFTPEDLRREWLAGNVRTRVKAPDEERLAARGLAVRDGLHGVRQHKWHEDPTGTTFEMGSRSSGQFARCYDRRGPTRFELELKHETAAVAAAEIFDIINDVPAFSALVLGLVRRFVDFVEIDSSEHSSRRELMPFWAAFVAGVEKASLSLGEVAERTLYEVWEWLERQAGPALALVSAAGGRNAVQELITRGRRRWRSRHREVLQRSVGWAVPG